MTGPLVLPGDPVSALQAADKSYVDTNVAAIAAGLAEKVSLVPSATQMVAQPSGTQLQVNNLNGELYASQYATGAGGNGLANAEASPDCASGCTIQVEPTYNGTPVATTTIPNQGLVEDRRGGGGDVRLGESLRCRGQRQQWAQHHAGGDDLCTAAQRAVRRRHSGGRDGPDGDDAGAGRRIEPVPARHRVAAVLQEHLRRAVPARDVLHAGTACADGQ